jgi:outer membrane protein TolC
VSELEATIKDYQEQLAAAQAELAELDKEPDEPPARPPLPPPLPGQRQGGPEGIFTSPEEAIAAAGPWSPEFQAWRKAHIPTSRGIIQ